jgi:ribosomal protein S18 acetylase RimI-like enzyme
MPARDEAVLDNLAWHALIGPHREFAEIVDGAARYLPDVSIFAAAAGDGKEVPPDWNALAELVGPGGVIALFRRSVGPIPAGFEVLFTSHAHQMVAVEPLVAASSGSEPLAGERRIVDLGDSDAADMVALAQLTEPGPFSARTNQLGRFVGVRDRGGRLVAIAGERFRADGWTEISGVCTHPVARAQGLAGALTLDIASGIHASGASAVLHVKEGNENALRLYRRLGFVERCKVDVVAVRAPS